MFSDFQLALAQNSDLTGIYLAGLEDPGQLTRVERTRFDYYLGMLFARFDTAVELYNRGMIDDRAMAPYSRFILYHFEFPGVAEYWRESQTFFSDAARRYIEGMRRSAPKRDPTFPAAE